MLLFTDNPQTVAAFQARFAEFGATMQATWAPVYGELFYLPLYTLERTPN